MKTLSKHSSFGGTTGFYEHWSEANQCMMKFSVYEPPEAKGKMVPVVIYLAGLTCNEETFMTKSGAQRVASELGLMIVAPDTSPRGDGVPDDPESAWDFGLGAGFYLNATEEPYSRNYKMDNYITRDLKKVIFENFNGSKLAQGIFGHSMGGHGALTLGLKYSDIYKSISAFAPICAPMSCPWGQKAFKNYLGDDEKIWRDFDASVLIKGVENAKSKFPILIDQGMGDQFLIKELHPHLLEKGAEKSGYPLNIRCHEGYDHGYYFISSFMEDHLRHHAKILKSEE